MTLEKKRGEKRPANSVHRCCKKYSVSSA